MLKLKLINHCWDWGEALPHFILPFCLFFPFTVFSALIGETSHHIFTWPDGQVRQQRAIAFTHDLLAE
jgi:hypothetical protein